MPTPAHPHADAPLAALSRFSEPTRAWFAAAFAEPTAAQVGAWEAIGEGRHALVVAPTGSGKTLSAFLWSLDRLLTSERAADACSTSARSRRWPSTSSATCAAR
jgi:ATP-dependent Lhr-like helicase